tara:strand:- start:598 stop:828 length:231 start_codon:yes stop_codon:yes gene_type:complete
MTLRITASSLHDRAALACKMLGLQPDQIFLKRNGKEWHLYMRANAEHDPVLCFQTAAEAVSFFNGVTFGVAHGSVA